jgi:hypothetical protein
MHVSLHTILDAPFERVREEVGKSSLLTHVAAPVITFSPIDPPAFPQVWSDGRYLVAMRFFGVLPVGQQWIAISHPAVDGQGVYCIRDNGAGQLARRWDHHITLRKRQDGRTDYQDDVHIEAGLLTPFVAAFAAMFYRHRQRRWRALVRSGFRYN